MIWLPQFVQRRYWMLLCLLALTVLLFFNSATFEDSKLSSSPKALNQEPQYVTVSFGATCGGGGMSNRLYEFVSLYGIARTLNRIPYASERNDCIRNELKKMASFFPLLTKTVELKNVSDNQIKNVDFASAKCCTYEDVGKLLLFNSSQFIAVSGWFLSFKYFDKYRSDVLKLLTFTKDDINATDHIAKDTFKNDKNSKICVHIRRGDYVTSSVHPHSTENFTNASVFYVREKLMKAGKNSTVAFLGDDRPWAQTLFANYSWAVVPARTERVTTDYAFFARHCQTIILTASASTFGFWSAYLSSAENVYYNVDFAKNDKLRNELTPADYFPPKWISLSLNSTDHIIYEVPRLS